MFIGRQAELAELNRLYEMTGFRFVVMYGRRRVGKTALITEFIKGKDCIFYISIERNDVAALGDFSAKVLERFPSASSLIERFPSWDSALSYISEQASEGRLVLAIDEYPYLASGNPSISSILQKHIDTSFRTTNLFLILCGSSMSFMENQVLGYKSPLYGRRSAQFHIKPFDYYDAGLFFPQSQYEDKMLAYAVCDGIPQYLNAVAECENVTDGICECFLKKTGVLYEEPENLLKQELREPAVYNTLISSTAGGASRLNEISVKSGEELRKCSKYLKSLIDLHILYKEYPYGVKTERKSVYMISDNMFRFWYRFIPQNVTAIESGLGREVYSLRIVQHLSSYLGRVFEDACRDYLKRQNGTQTLPFMFDGIGRWWGTNPETRAKEEIDIIADSGEKAIFGECKWTSSEVGPDVLTELKRKSKMLAQYTDTTLFLFSKTGFRKSLTDLASQSSAVLISLQELYDLD